MDDTVISGLADAISRMSETEKLISLLKSGKKVSAAGVSGNAKSAFLRALKKSSGKRVVYVSPSDTDIKQSGGFVFPSEPLQLRSMEVKSRENGFQRIEALFSAHDIIALRADALLRRFMPRGVFCGYITELQPAFDIPPKALAEKLVFMGYEKVKAVYAKGQFAQRGEIMDIFSPCHERPVRVVFFDTEIEYIKYFDADTQKTEGDKLGRVNIYPAEEYLMDSGSAEKCAEYFRKYAGEDSATGADAAKNAFSLKETGTFANMDSFYHAFADTVSVLDYFDDAIVVLDSEYSVKAYINEKREEHDEEYKKLYAAKEVFFLQQDALFAAGDVTASLPRAFVDISAHSGRNSVDLGMRAPVMFSGNMPELAKSLKERMRSGWRTALCVGAKAESLSRALMEFDIIAPVDGVKASVFCSRERLVHGCEIPSQKLLFLGEGDVYTTVRKAASKEKRHMDKADEELFAELKSGDYVVHEVHGRGRYLGLKKMQAAGNIGEYLELEYKDGDKLYIPTAQIGRIQKYIGGEDGAPMLSKLGGREWENVKKRASESVKKLAFDLVKLYSERYENKGYAFSPDTVWQSQFEDAFDYELTDGQRQSLKEIKADMESLKVMDRLLLGDVGYGKTEIAMRAAFKAVMDSKQVCMLVPTTLLARQHGDTFRKRFEGYPVKIEVLSRYSGSKKEREIMKKASDGGVDIIIGTHKLLSSQMGFRDLGLLIIDEEQRFGVAHKEKLKLLKNSVDVLTLSATPIPRTLEMSLIGVRDLSTIKTPPQERREVMSYVMKYSESLVKDAVMRELSRGGQVYFVVRQVMQMERMLSDLRRIVPEARIDCAHGQMSAAETERAVSAFINGGTDVLLCTTIIESGIDIPRVNTVIIYEADKFGLSQLYQLRGRVGRSDRTAYAYFTFLSSHMGENAGKRLAAIKEFTALGSGFKIAMRDLQIRGAGNLLGPEQSGHMTAVGYTLYCRMMRDAIEGARGKEVKEPETDAVVDLGAAAYIPSSYIADDELKLEIYKRIARITDIGDAKTASSELADRFGALPGEVNNLIMGAVVKRYASAAGIASVIKKDKAVELNYDQSVNFDLEKLMLYLQENKKMASLRATTPPAVLLKAGSVRSLISFLHGLRHCKREV